MCLEVVYIGGTFGSSKFSVTGTRDYPNTKKKSFSTRPAMDLLKFRSTLILLLITGGFVMCFHTTNAASTKVPSKVCESEVCRNTATSILQKMNKTVNPCDNFYEYVCGNFSKNAVIPSSSLQIDLFEEVNNLVQIQLRNSIENQITKKDPEAFQKLLTYYNTCMDEEQIEKTSIKEFLGILKKLGGWPVLMGKSKRYSRFDLIDAINKISKMGYSHNYFLSSNIASDMKNNTRNVIYLDQPVLGISQEYLSKGLENDVVKAYFKFMIDLAEILGADREQAKQELGESLQFEIGLANISLSEADRRDNEKLYNPMTISEIQSKYPYIPWLRYLNDQLSPFYQLSEDDVVIVSVPSFFESLGDLLARTPKRVLANYAMWQVVFDSAPQLNRKVLDARIEFKSSTTGNKNRIPRWQICVSSASSDLYIATSALYVRRNFDKASKDGVLDLVKHLRQSFKTILLEVDWMDEATRSAAMEKLEQIIPLVGYFDESLDDEKINNYYKDLKLHRKSFLKSVLSYNRFNTIQQLKKYGQQNPRLDWTTSYYASDVVNAFYDPTVNTIQFPAGILQGEFYAQGNPKYVNYGAIGCIIGHEMTHGFDDQGSLFDRIGNMIDWWKADTKKEYLRRTKCIVDQYSRFFDSQAGLYINGDLTQGENIADNGGLKESYLAYLAFEKEKGEEPILPGFEEFTPRQLFWISYSNVWCAKYRTEHLKDLITTDPHSPNQFRIIGPLSNNPYFAKDFNCPVGSPMNPEKKCSVW